MQNLADLLGKKYRSEIRYFRAVEIIQKNWKLVVNDLSRFLVPRNIYKNQLVIECNNPVWMSEIDCFKPQIIDKVNYLLNQNRSNIAITGIKPLLNANLITKEKKTHQIPPKSFEDRIQWRLNQKKNNGAKLCLKCQKVWDMDKTCRLCQLTV